MPRIELAHSRQKDTVPDPKGPKLMAYPMAGAQLDGRGSRQRRHGVHGAELALQACVAAAEKGIPYESRGRGRSAKTGRTVSGIVSEDGIFEGENLYNQVKICIICDKSREYRQLKAEGSDVGLRDSLISGLKPIASCIMHRTKVEFKLIQTVDWISYNRQNVHTRERLNTPEMYNSFW